MRIDKLLWYLRLARSRTIAQTVALSGHIRLNGRRVERAHQGASPGDILVVPHGQSVRVIELLAMPVRRGAAPEAQSCYRVLDVAENFPLAAAERNDAARGDLQP